MAQQSQATLIAATSRLAFFMPCGVIADQRLAAVNLSLGRKMTVEKVKGTRKKHRPF